MKNRNRTRVRVVVWVVAISYMIGAPVAVYLELHGHTLSERFDLPAGLIYFTSAIQFVCSIVLLLPRFTILSSALLTLIALGAVASHLRIGSPLTALPALAYVAVQIWIIVVERRHRVRPENPG